MFKMYSFEYDVIEGKVTQDCKLKPSELNQSDGVCWLYASNTTPDSTMVYSNKIGKWMVFVPRRSVDDVWDKVKAVVSKGELWEIKVSTVNPKNSSHVLIVYTKDYTDLSDVINTLDTLEKHGIKSPDTVIRYKTDEQTRAGIYSGGKEKPWIYRSDTIREIGITSSSGSSGSSGSH